jgi:hypothetical protein
MPEPSQELSLRRATSEYRWLAEARARTVRFHLSLNFAFAVLAIVVLKITGPVYADAIAAALFGCGFATALLSARTIRNAEREYRTAQNRMLEMEYQAGLRSGEFQPEQPRMRGITAIFVCFAVLHLFAAALVLIMTYVMPPEPVEEEETPASTSLVRVCSECGP